MNAFVADVRIYTTRFCGFCFAAKRLLSQKGVDFQEIQADSRPDLRSWLREVSGQHTVPQIFINGESIGGYSELSGLDRGGQLDGKLSTPPQGDFSHLRS
ncbi:MAG: glutaredoxin [Myxococcales bacterium]|nr:glutaredoxin [Myxococcales bacterium]